MPPATRPHSCKARHPSISTRWEGQLCDLQGFPPPPRAGSSVCLGGSSPNSWGLLPLPSTGRPFSPAPCSGLAPACTSQVTASAPSGLLLTGLLPMGPLTAQRSPHPVPSQWDQLGGKGLPSAPGATEASSSVHCRAPPPHRKQKTSGARRVTGWPGQLAGGRTCLSWEQERGHKAAEQDQRPHGDCQESPAAPSLYL